jgi:hypothetical protein
MRSEVTIIASSYYNGPVEYNFRNMEENIRVTLIEAGLPLEFQDKVIKHDAYLRNCTNIRPETTGINRSTLVVFIGTLLDVDMQDLGE